MQSKMSLYSQVGSLTMPTKSDKTFMDDMPIWLRVLVQLGAFGVMTLLFVQDSRDRSSQLREMQTETRQQARDDRQMFRDELKLQREELKVAVGEMKRAVDHLDASHKALKKDVDDIKFPVPAPHTKPQE